MHGSNMININCRRDVGLKFSRGSGQLAYSYPRHKRHQLPTTPTPTPSITIMGHTKVWMLLMMGSLALNLCYNLAQATTTTPTPTASHHQSRALISETPRSQQQQQQPQAGSNKKTEDTTLSRRNGGGGGGSGRRRMTTDGNQQQLNNLVASNLPPELTMDDSEGGELFVNEDGNLETTGPSVVSADGLLAGSGSPFGSSAPEYEADASTSTDLIDLPPNMQLTPAQLQSAHSAVHNLRLLRQSNSPQPTRFNLDPMGQAQQQQQRQQIQQQMMVTTTQQTPPMAANQNRPQNGNGNNNNLLPISSVVTTMMSPRNVQGNQQQQQQQQMQQAMNNVGPRAFQQQAAAQASQRAFDQLPPSGNLQASTFNVNMGADRMLIKPQGGHQQAFTTPTSATTTTRGFDQQAEMATESVNHELLTRVNGMGGGGAQVDHGASHQDLLYPSSSIRQEQDYLQQQQQPSRQQRQQHQFNPHQQEPQYKELTTQVTNQAICYTPVALLIVILVTMLVTVVVCFATHIVMKHLGRHQFDLIANRKHFDTRHGNGFLKGESGEGVAPEAAGGGAKNQKQFSMLSSYHEPAAGKPSSSSYPVAGQLRDELGNYAFDNPYFRDEPTSMLPAGACLRQQQTETRTDNVGQQQQVEANNSRRLLGHNHQHQHHQAQGTCSHTAATTNAPTNNGLKESAAAATGSDQLDFIEHHISNLHNKQVTSSVKELSILGSTSSSHEQVVTSPYLSQHVVDLTSEEQRSRVIADPKEGDLVAVDLTGHDFIGLGFDICGNAQEGIFIRSVLSRGPARESNCVHPGDRIKCLNISFEGITLQDACDILNCGSPYKLRLLLEKRALPSKLVAEKQRQAQPAPINLRRVPLSSQLIGCNQLSAHPTQSSSLASKQQSNVSGPFSATRSYIKRLASLMTAGSASGNSNNSSQQLHGNLHNYRDQFGITTPAFHDQLMVDHHHHHQSAYLGSSAARLRRTSNTLGNPIFPPLDHSHINTGYGSDDGDDTGDDELAIATGAAAAAPGIRNSNNGHRMRRMSRSSMDHDDGGGRMMRHSRFSVNSADLFGSRTSTANEFGGGGGGGADSSLDYHNQNANHRLHGPAYSGNNNNNPNRHPGDHANLRLASHEAVTGVCSGGGGASRNYRHQGSRGASFNDQHHLEQSQSQPEIAHRATTGNSKLASTDDLREPSGFEQHRNGRRSQMMNSMSTPTMNLLQQQQQEPADWRASYGKRTRSGDGNKDNKQQEHSIREEAGSESSYGDSTSKLVDGSGSRSKGDNGKIQLNPTSGAKDRDAKKEGVTDQRQI